MGVRTRWAVSLRPCPLRLRHLSCGVVWAAAFNWFLKITSVTSMDNQNIEILCVNSSQDNFFVLLARVVQLHRLTVPSPRKEARVTRHKRSILKSTVCQRQMERHQTREFVMWNIIPHSFWSLSVLNTFLTRFMNRSLGTTDVTDTFQANLSWNTVITVTTTCRTLWCTTILSISQWVLQDPLLTRNVNVYSWNTTVFYK
jgi:hypothetical protein